MTPQDEIACWQARFRVLQDWEIQFDDASDYGCQSTRDPDECKAIIYDCPDWFGEGRPPDYLLHEILHTAYAAAQRQGREGEELLVQDICLIIHPLRLGDTMKITDKQLENWFTYHAPDEDQQRHYQAINEAAKKFAEVVVDNTPSCADQSAAIRKIREARMTANAAIACKGQ